MDVVFRVDSSLSIGTGHVMRCLNVANQFKDMGGRCSFITKTHNGNIIDKIHDAKFPVKEIVAHESDFFYIADEKKWLGGTQEDDAKLFCSFIVDDGIVPDIIILDHYSLDIVWEQYIKTRFPSCCLVVIDDLCNRKHYCDFIVDQTFGRQALEYLKYNFNNAKLLIGSEYALLHPKFRKLKSKSLSRKERKKKKKNILITMGGVDNNNITEEIISFLDGYYCDFINEIDIVIGSQYKFKDELQKAILKLEYKIRIHQNINNMPELMMIADLAIGALGGTTWERCVMGLPAVNICIANNQKIIAQKISSVGLVVLDANFLNRQNFLASLTYLHENYEFQKELTNKICDGYGLIRLAQELVPIPAKDGINIKLSPATEADTTFVYQLQCMAETRRFARNPQVPSWDEHRAWMQSKLRDNDSFYYIINHEAKCGVLRLDPTEHKNVDYEISIFLSNSSFGKGIASAAIKRAMNIHKSKTIIATVHPDNNASNKLFESVGFIRISENQFINKVL